MKLYFPDTNVLMQNSYAMYILSGNIIPNALERERYDNILSLKGKEHDETPNDIILSDIVVRELDNIKSEFKRDSWQRSDARSATRVIEEMISQYGYNHMDKDTLIQSMQMRLAGKEDEPEDRKKSYARKRYGDMNGFIELDNGARVYILEPNLEAFDSVGTLYPDNDDRLVFQAATIASNDGLGILKFVSNDYVARFKAARFKIDVEEFEYERITDPNQLYRGFSKHMVEPMIDSVRRSISARQGFNLSNSDIQRSLGKVPRPNQLIQFLDASEGVSWYIAKPHAKSIDFRYCNAYDKLKEDARSFNEHSSKEFNILDVPVDKRIQFMTSLVNMSGANKKQKRSKNGRITAISEADDEMVKIVYREVTKSMGTIGKPYLAKVLDSIGCQQDVEGRWNSVNLKFNIDFNLVHEQVGYMELLKDIDIGLVTVNGPAGTGKSLWAMYCALLQVLDNTKPYDGMIYVRSTVEAGEGLGFLPGTERSKLAPWMETAYGSLEYIFGVRGESPTKKNIFADKISRLEEDGIIQFKSIDYVAGRTLPNKYIIVDEAQLFHPKQIKLLVGRVGIDSKIVLIGDMDQISTNKGTKIGITERSSGLVNVIERLIDQNNTAHIYLPERCVMRSEVAKLANLI
ncbi:PhoH family protein [Candidatus Woesearchaeota archaeon]|nr:PhoH family protein [Candidatus Woesearchaeota archaeon]